MDLILTTLDICKIGDLTLPDLFVKAKRLHIRPSRTAYNLVVQSVKNLGIFFRETVLLYMAINL
jgi:hypothetical protein